MTVLVIGAAGLHDEPIHRAAAGMADLRLVMRAAVRPDWILVSTSEQRTIAVSQYRLPPYRIIVAPMLAAAVPIAPNTLVELLTKMREIGPSRALASRWGVRIARPLLPYMVAAMTRFALAHAGEHWRERRSAEKLQAQDAKEAARAARRATKPERKPTDIKAG